MTQTGSLSMRRALANGGDHECSDTSLHVTTSKSTRQSVSRLFCRVSQAGCIAGLDFTPQRGALAVGNGRVMRRGRLASMVHRINVNVRKPRSIQFCADALYIVVAMRGTGQETRGIMREDCRQRFRDRISKLVLRNSVPYIEEEATARLKDSPRLEVTLNLVRKEHHAELAGQNVKTLVLKRQCQSICLFPLDSTILRLPCPCATKHRLI